jgi:hypothetical protein
MWSDPVFKRLGKDYFCRAEMAETRVEKYDDIYHTNQGSPWLFGSRNLTTHFQKEKNVLPSNPMTPHNG